MTMVQPRSNGAQHPTNSFSDIPTLFQLRSFIRHCRCSFVRQNRTCQPTSTDEGTLLSRDGDVVADDD